jgi:hypothetical protein
VGRELLDSDRSMVRVELGGVEVGQAGGAEHLDELEPGAENLGADQCCGRQRPESLLYGMRDLRGGVRWR